MRIILAILLLASSAWGGIVEVVDDDPHQYINFNNWNPAIDSLGIAVSLDLDSGFWEIPSALNNVTSSELFEYIDPNHNSDDDLIPGHYTGEYWVITTAYIDDEAIPSGDTSHVTVDYTVSVPIDYQKWDHGNGQKEMQFGGTIQNYPDSNGWHPIENNWILDGDSIYVARRSVLKATATPAGEVGVTLPWKGNEYTTGQTLQSLKWFRVTDSASLDIDTSPQWSNIEVDSNIIKWTNVFPSVDYRVRKSNGSVAHGIFFKSPFLDSMVILLNQRSDSSDLYLANVMTYNLSSNIDDWDQNLGNIRRRLLKRVGSFIFELGQQRVFYPGYDTLPEVPVWQRHRIVGNQLYVYEFVKATHLRQIHQAYPNATISHNTEIYIAGSAANVDANGLWKNNPLRNYGKHADIKVGDDFQPQERFWHTIIRFNTLDDSMRNVGAATWDSARIGLTIDLLMESAESLAVTAHKITTAGWLEGEGIGEDTCGSSWDSANGTGYTSCAGSPLDWTTDGGDYSATRETYGSHADSLFISPDIQSLDDTVYFYISSATVSDTMGNKAGILLYPLQFIDDDNDNTVGFDSDDQTSRRPFLQVWYTAGAPPAGYPMRRQHIIQKLQGDS